MSNDEIKKGLLGLLAATQEAHREALAKLVPNGDRTREEVWKRQRKLAALADTLTTAIEEFSS